MKKVKNKEKGLTARFLEPRLEESWETWLKMKEMFASQRKPKKPKGVRDA